MIDSIIKLLFRLYFNTLLKNLTKKNFDNANTIYNYLYAKQIEIVYKKEKLNNFR